MRFNHQINWRLVGPVIALIVLLLAVGMLPVLNGLGTKVEMGVDPNVVSAQANLASGQADVLRARSEMLKALPQVLASGGPAVLQGGVGVFVLLLGLSILILTLSLSVNLSSRGIVRAYTEYKLHTFADPQLPAATPNVIEGRIVDRRHPPRDADTGAVSGGNIQAILDAKTNSAYPGARPAESKVSGATPGKFTIPGDGLVRNSDRGTASADPVGVPASGSEQSDKPSFSSGNNHHNRFDRNKKRR